MDIFYLIGYFIGAVLTSNCWWFGFFVGASVFFKLGLAWQNFTKRQEYFWGFGVLIFSTIGILLSTL